MTRGSAAMGAVGLGMALACGGGPSAATGRSADNASACAAYVERINGLGACVQVTYDPENLCGGVDELPPEMAAYYDCLRDRARCEADALTFGAEGCAAPVVSLAPQKLAGPVDFDRSAGSRPAEGPSREDGGRR
ncbi:MAG: hypothetical protein ABMA64_22175 [Myxococcota bacterium]